MDSFVLASAGRLRRLEAGESLVSVYSGPPMVWITQRHAELHADDMHSADRDNVVAAYLAANKPDGEQPIDEAFVRECGFKQPGTDPTVWQLRCGHLVLIWNTSDPNHKGWLIADDGFEGVKLIKNPTRRHLRQLLSVLGKGNV